MWFLSIQILTRNSVKIRNSIPNLFDVEEKTALFHFIFDKNRINVLRDISIKLKKFFVFSSDSRQKVDLNDFFL